MRKPLGVRMISNPTPASTKQGSKHPPYTISPSQALSAAITYTVRVVPVNGSGDGAPSADATGRPAPGQVTLVAEDPPVRPVTPGEGKLTVNWVDVMGEDEYKVQWKSGTDDWDPSNRQGMEDEDATSSTITGLTAGTPYTVRVIAVNTSGDGTPSAEATETPKPGQVGTPTVVSGEGNLTVSWTAVSGTGIGYKVQWRDGSTVASWDEFRILRKRPKQRRPERAIRFRSLSAATTFTVRVIATHDLTNNNDPTTDDGTPSDDATGTPKPGPDRNRGGDSGRPVC